MAKLPLDSFFGAKSFEKMIELAMSFNKEIFSPKDVGVSYTNINYWDKKGILSSHRKNESQWRNFTFVDYVWIRVIDEMRSMGVSVDLIKGAKEILFEELDVKPLYKILKTNIDKIKKSMSYTEEQKDEIIRLMLEGEKKTKEEGVTSFYMAIVNAIFHKTPVSILISNDGYLMIWAENYAHTYPKEDIEFKTFETHISISISKIIKDFLLDKKSVFLLPDLQLLQPNEIRLMELIHSGNYDSISIHFKDKKMKNLELKKSQDTKVKIVDILSEGAYQDIEIVSHKGMITKIENTIKIILD